MKPSRLRKLTWKVLALYAVALVLIGFSDPDPRKVTRLWFWTGIALLAAGQTLRFWAAGHLRKNKELTMTGPYAHVRNPLYLGTLLALIGFAFVARSDPAQPLRLFRYLNWLCLAAALLVFFLYYVPRKKRREEEHLRNLFRAEWEDYKENVPAYWPRRRRYASAPRRPWSWTAVRDNSELWTPVALVAAVLAVIFNQRLLDLASRVWR